MRTKKKAAKAVKKVSKKVEKKKDRPKKAGRVAPKKEFRLKVGKFYESRVGEVLGPIIKTPTWRTFANSHPFTTESGPETYRADGTYDATVGFETAFDLVREVPPPKARVSR